MKRIILLIFTISTVLSAQVETNFEVIQSGLDSVANYLSEKVDHSKTYNLDIQSPTEYSILRTSLQNSIANKIKLDGTSNKIDVTINEVNLNYNDCFRDGIFGDFYTERIVKINSSLNSESFSEIGNFEIELKDTIKLDDIDKVENSAYNFTRSEKPEEPFLSGLTEPIIAVSAIVVSIYLLFSVRSN